MSAGKKLSYTAREVLGDFLKGWEFVGWGAGGRWQNPAGDAGEKEGTDGGRFPWGSRVVVPEKRVEAEALAARGW